MPSTNEKKWPVVFAFLFLIPVVDLFLGSNLPYEYFLLLRVVGFGGLAYLAFLNFKQETEIAGVKYFLIFGGLAILYNPFLPVSLTRGLWTPINLATGLLVLQYCWGRSTDSSKNQKEPFVQQASQLNSAISSSINSERTGPWRNDTPQEDRIEKALELISQPLLKQREMFMYDSQEAAKYLQSHSAIGFVGGFTDGYLQKMATQLSLNNSDEHSVMGLVLAVIFEGINDDYMEYFELNNKSNPEFNSAQSIGGYCAFDFVNDPSREDEKIGWHSHFLEWCDAN